MARDAAEHFCPAWPKADCTKSFTAASISAQEVMRTAFFPLVSAIKLISGRHDVNKDAVSNEPVRMSPSISGCVMRYFPFSSSRIGKNCRTSLGTPPAHKWLTISQAVATVSGAGLRITVFPAANAAHTPPIGIAYGKFQGGTTKIVPSGVDSPKFWAVVA